MAAACSYPLLVELGENDAPRLKIKLVKHFQSKKAGGGECEVEYVNGSRTAVLRFRREEDQKSVLARGVHQISLDKGAFLEVSVRLLKDESKTQEAPADKVTTKSADVTKKKSTTDKCVPGVDDQKDAKDGDDETTEEELCSTSAVLGNIQETMNQEFLELLVQNISRDPDSPSASQTFTLEIIPVISSAVVQFQSGKEATDFVARCPQNKMFTKKGLSAKLLEVTKQIIVEDLQNINEEVLEMYFENSGCEVEGVVMNEVEQSAIITFKDHKAAQKALKKKHRVREKDIRVFGFYKSLGTALYGKEKPPLRLPATISEPIDGAIWTYINGNQSEADTIRSLLAKHFCTVNLNQSTVSLIPEPSLLQEKDAKAIIKDWKDTVKSVFAKFLLNFKSLKFALESELWEESEKKIRQMLENKDLVVVSEKASGVLSVAGLVDIINGVEQTLYEAINKVGQRLQREKSCLTQEIKISYSIFHILCQGGLKDRLLSLYPELKMLHEKDSPNLIVTGLSDEINKARTIIYERKLELKSQRVELDHSLLNLLKDEQPEELTETLFTSNGINAAFEISQYRVQLIAANDKDLKNAEDQLEKMLISQDIDVEDSNVLKKPEWRHLVSQLEKASSKPWRRIQIHISGPQVVVCGHKDGVKRVSYELTDFLTQNAHVEQNVVVKSKAIAEYIRKQKQGLTGFEEVVGKVKVSYREDAICLSGSKVDVLKHKSVVENQISSVYFETLNITIPGAKKFFKDQEDIYMPLFLNEHGCQVHLIDDVSGGQGDLANRQVSNPVYQLQTNDGVEIVICKANMCSYPVQAVVNPANQDLKHRDGLAQALLKAAGPQLQDECDRLIKSCGPISPGHSVITAAGGQLNCKKVIHAVAPKFDSANLKKARGLLKRTVKGSLELAATSGCVSVALPAIGRSLSFPLDLCALTVVQAVKEYCDETYDDTIKSIHFVEDDDSIVQAVVAVVRQEFGNHGAAQTQQNLPTQGIKFSPVIQTPHNPNRLGQVETKEGLDITLMRGNIEDAMTDVTVNSVSGDYDLSKGAISNAILRAAGPNLQTMVNAENGSGSDGEIIVTEGCQLRSMFIYHAVTPKWDNGQGSAQKILSGIVKDCLNKAEDNSFISITFPAIGTGNLKFPKDLIAQLMLDEIIKFSKKIQPKFLKKVVITLHPGDAATVQAFDNEFKKTFSNASGGPVPAKSGPFSKVVPSTGMYETKMGSVTVQAVTGDITKETTDVIVNSSNDKFSLKSGVSKAILDAAGQGVEDECHDLGAQPHSGIIMTQPGNLSCKKIIHVVAGTSPERIKAAVTDALQMCVKNSYTSVAFPALGTGQGSVQVKNVADAMLDAVIDVLSQNSSSTLNTIRIVIFQPKMLKEFYHSMQQREATDAKATSWFGKLKAFFVGSADKQQQEEDFVIVPVKVDAAFFHICGGSQAGVAATKQKINDLISKQRACHCIPYHATLHFFDADRRRISNIQETMSVSIKTDKSQGQTSLIIEGLSKDVLRASSEISEMVRKAKEEEDLKNQIENTSEEVAWQYQQGTLFHNFDLKTNYELEQAYKKNLPSVNVTIQGQPLTVQMPSGPATDNQGQILTIQRYDKIKGEDLPPHWDTIPVDASCLVVTLTEGTTEYTEVQTLFQASCGDTITKIERIQNLRLWKTLQFLKSSMDKKNGHQHNERRLFHGTTEDIVGAINERGFNRNYAGKNAANYGNGTYFAVKASYSAHDTYSKPDKNNEKRMYLCRVLTGDYTLGKKGMDLLPNKDPNSTDIFNSLVDNKDNPNMFIIFHDHQAYPEYLITFKR